MRTLRPTRCLAAELAGGRAFRRSRCGRPIQAVLGMSLVLSACSWYPQERGQRLEQRVDRMEGDGSLTQMEASRTATQQENQRLEARIAELEKRVAATSGADRQQHAQADAASRQQLADELGRLRSTLESQAKRLDAIEGSVAQLRTGGASRVSEREPRPARPEPRRQARTTAVAPSPPAVQSKDLAVPSDRSRYLAFARQQESRGDKSVARDLYQEYVNQYPNDPTAAEAHFRLGELAYGDKRYREATLEFGKVAKDFPQSDRAPEALLRTADSMLGMKLRDEAILVLSQLPKRYPASPAAARATERLAELTSGTGASANHK